MPLSEDQLNLCDSLINRVATEMVLASSGSDDGMVPVYSLINEFSGIVDTFDQPLHTGCVHARQALDELLDESKPFDDRTLEYISNFTAWAQECLLNIRNGGTSTELAPAPWIGGDEEAGGESLSEKEHACNELVNRIATELVLANAGSDDGLVPIYSLASELIDHSTEIPQLHTAVSYLREALDNLLDKAKPFDLDTISYTGTFVAWAQDALRNLIDGREIPEPFEPMKKPGAEAPAETPKSEPVGPEAKAPAERPPQAAQPRPAAPAPKEPQPHEREECDALMEINDEDQEILGEFQTEAIEHLENIEAAVLVLEHDPLDGDSLALIFRAFHTIKGVAGFLHLVPIQALAHQVETLLDNARNHKLTLDSSMITLILQAKDTLQRLVGQITDAIERGIKPTVAIPVSHIIKAVQGAIQTGLDVAAGKIPAPVAAVPEPPQTTSEQESQQAAPKADGEATPTPPQNNIPAPQQAPAAAQPATAASTIRVKTSKLDNLMDMVGELVIVQSQLTESSKTEVVGENTHLQQSIAQLQRITRELQHTSMSLRLVPIKPTFQKVSRMVRDLARQVNKRVNFRTEGEETELDRNVVEQINDPLVHMIRNSLDHGIEASEEARAEAGKPLDGQIVLKAYHQGSSIVIELSDDGRGIDPQKILAKARKTGLVREDQNLSRQEILALIFEPGFSTAEKVTDISGRGVGMDVVRRNIEKLRGTVELESTFGKGTTFKIKLPLTTAIIDGLVVRVGEDRFILPTTSVKVALRPEKKQITTIKGKTEVLDLRGKTIPLVRLHRLFNIETNVGTACDGIVVIIETFGKPFGLLVDDMLSKQEVVIKSLGSMMKGIPGVAGGAILGDGTIALILDPSSLIGGN